jgi:hypothetical protein
MPTETIYFTKEEYQDIMTEVKEREASEKTTFAAVVKSRCFKQPPPPEAP